MTKITNKYSIKKDTCRKNVCFNMVCEFLGGVFENYILQCKNK